jgi:HAE1 family hydrophobic/amphiphilic exporter-1
MNITQFSIKRPLALIMVVIAIFVFGGKAYKSLNTSLMPETNIPFVLVQTIYPGASAEVVESQVSIPIEKELYSLSGLKDIRSYSSTNASVAMLEFSMETDPDQAIADVTKRLNEFKPNLPQDITDPKIQKMDNNSAPVIEYALYSDNKAELDSYIQNTLKPRIERIEGVGKVDVSGLGEREVVVELNSNAAAKGITASQISDALSNKVFGSKLPSRIPLGSLNEQNKQIAVELNSEFKTLDEVKNFYLIQSNSSPAGKVSSVRIGDVADVRVAEKKQETFFRANGKSAIGISVTKQSDASDVAVAENVKKLIGGEKPLPLYKMLGHVVGLKTEKEEYSPALNLKSKNIEAKVVSDQSIWIKESVDGVMESLVEGILLTGLFLLLFLRSARSTIIVLLAIPTSIVITFIGMKTFGFTLNIVSLLGVAMSVGILVDDSIVVIENIFAKLRKISDPQEAAMKGRMEIASAAIAITLVDVVVYLPLALLTGMVGQFFRQFALVVVVATLSSLAVAFTITPMLTSRLVTQKDERGYKWLAWSERVLDKLRDWYGLFLMVLSKNGWRVAGAIVLIFSLLIGSVALTAPKLKQEFLITGDDGKGQLSIQFPAGTEVEKVNSEMAKIESALQKETYLENFYLIVGQNSGNSANISFDFGPKENRSKSAKDLTSDLQSKVKNMLDSQIIVSQSQQSTGWGNKEVQYALSGENFNKLVELKEQFAKKITNLGILTDVEFSLGEKSESLVLNLGEKSSSKGLSSMQIMALTSGRLKTESSGFLNDGSDNINIVVKDSAITSETDLRSLALAPGINLESGVEFAKETAYRSIEHINKQRSITFSANLAKGVDSGKASREVEKAIADLKLPDGYAIEADSSTRLMQEGFAELGNALILSILLIFMIMVALYESLLIPFVIMFTLPTAVAGSLVLLYLLGAPMDITAMVGFIALMGLVAKNGILLVDFMEKERKSGSSIQDAIVNAGRRRLRPILMTTLAIIIASIPLVLGNVPGSEFRRGIAIVFIGGLLSSLFLTLILIPSVYFAVVSIQSRFKRSAK